MLKPSRLAMESIQKRIALVLLKKTLSSFLDLSEFDASNNLGLNISDGVIYLTDMSLDCDVSISFQLSLMPYPYSYSLAQENQQSS